MSSSSKHLSLFYILPATEKQPEKKSPLARCGGRTGSALTIWDICFATSAIRWDIVFLVLITLHNSDMLFFFSTWFFFFLVRTSDVCGCSPGCAWLNGEHACTICAVRLVCSVLFYHRIFTTWALCFDLSFLIELCAGRCSLIVMRMGKFTIESNLSFVQKWLYFYNDHSCAHKASTDTQNTCQHSPRSQSILNYASASWNLLQVIKVAWSQTLNPKKSTASTHPFGRNRFLRLVGLNLFTSIYKRIKNKRWHWPNANLKCGEPVEVFVYFPIQMATFFVESCDSIVSMLCFDIYQKVLVCLWTQTLWYKAQQSPCNNIADQCNNIRCKTCYFTG